MIKLLQEPDGERISKVRLIGLVLGVFLIVIIPITYYISLAKAEREKKMAERDRAALSTSTVTAKTITNISQQMKEKSGNAIANYSTAMDDSKTPSLSGNNSNFNNNNNEIKGNNQEQAPPLTNNNVPSVSSNDPFANEIKNQKLDKIKRSYDGINAPISLGSQTQSNTKMTNPNVAASTPNNLNPTSQTNNSSQSNGSSPDKATVANNSGIGIGGATSSNGGFSGMFPNSGASGSNQSGDQNQQDEKRAFLANAAGGDSSSTTNPNRVQEMKSKYTLTAGDFIPSIMISGLNSDTPGQVIAQVSTNMYDTVTGRYLLIPKGSRLIGIYDSKVAYMQQRIIVAWKRVIFPDGKSFLLQGLPGTDLAGYSGFYNPDGIDNHYWQIFGTSFVMGVITGAMQLSQNNTNANSQAGGNGVTNNDPSVGQTLSGSLGQQLGQTGLSITNKGLQIQPTITIPPGYEFNIMLTADLILTPYSQKYK